MSVPTKLARLVASASKIRCELGEAAIWDNRASRLLWVDVLNATLFIVQESSSAIEIHDLKQFTQHITTVVPVEDVQNPELKNSVILGTTEGIAKYDLTTRVFENHPANPIHKTIIPKGAQARGNDGKADPKGRLWLGTLVRDLKTLDVVDKAAGLYCLDGWHGTPTQVLANVTVSNGIAWHENKLYYTDSPSCHIDVMDFNTTDSLGKICNTRRQHIKVSSGYPPVPDGCIVDKEGFVWSALFGAGCVRRYCPLTGAIVAQVQLPPEAGPQATALAWGGEKFADLYITTGHEYWNEEQKNEFPTAGKLFICDANDIATLCGGEEQSMGCPPYKFHMMGSDV
jgi:sugar lactone lactonase YvrE